MSFLRNFNFGLFVQKCNDFMTAMVAATNYPSTFIDVSNFERVVFLVELGTTDSAMDFQVKQDKTETASADIKNVTGAVKSFLDTDDNKWATIEVETAKLDIANGFHYVTLNNAGAAGGNDYACITVFGVNPRHQPPTQPANYIEAVIVAG